MAYIIIETDSKFLMDNLDSKIENFADHYGYEALINKINNLVDCEKLEFFLKHIENISLDRLNSSVQKPISYPTSHA